MVETVDGTRASEGLQPRRPGGWVPGHWWHWTPHGRVQCDLCPRHCALRVGQRGACYVRQADAHGVALTTYGRVTHYWLDPIEKKPLKHFHPGTGTLSFGTAGCNLECRYCSRWDLAQAREDRVLAAHASPQRIAELAAEAGMTQLAFSYNEPLIYAEFAIDCAKEAHQLGLKTIAVSNGYASPDARRDFFRHMDAATLELKGFSEEFYREVCGTELAPVLETLRHLVTETGVWVEVATALIPGMNDSLDEVRAMTEWHATHLGREVPLHFLPFRPAHGLQHVRATPPETLLRAREQAFAAGIAHVYTGNAVDAESHITRCAGCGQELIGRDGAVITRWNLDEGRCTRCRRPLAGHFRPRPGNFGNQSRPIHFNGGSRTT